MKILVGVDKGTSYTFNAVGKTITLIGTPNILLDQLLLVTNVTSNEIIYSPVIPGKGATISGAVITLDYDTSSMNNSDNLQIFIYLKNDQVVEYSSDTLDAFGYLPVNSPVVIFESSLEFGQDADSWEIITATGGTTSYSTFSSTMDLTVGPTAGSSVIREQHGYNYYVPGIANTVLVTGVLGASAAGVTKRIGYYNDNNGFYFEQENGVMFACLRSYSSGTVVTQKFTQSSWNIDKMDGSNNYALNPSGITFDASKAQVFFFDYQWLGVGRVRYGLIIDGKRYIIHEIRNANNTTTTYMGSPSLPVRYEVFLTSNTTSTLKAICTSVITNNNDVPISRLLAVSNGATTKTLVSNTRTSLLSMRLSPTLEGRNNRSRIIISDIDVITTSNNTIYVEIVLQRSNLGEPNLGGPPSWTTLNNSAVQYSVDGTTTTGGSVIWSGYVNAQTRNINVNISSKHDFLANNYNCSQSDYLHIMCTSIGGNSSLLGSIKFLEIR